MIKRELLIFLIVGVTTVLVDFASYRGLAGYRAMEVDMAKATGFVAGSLFAYFANRFWTFGRKSHVPGSAWRFSALYATTLGANVLINGIVLKLLADAGGAVQWAFLVATGGSASLNFLGMKFFVFKPITSAEHH